MEGVHMLDGITDEEVEHFLEEQPTIVPLLEIDVITTIESSIAKAAKGEVLNQSDPYPTTITELRQAQDAFKRELAISQWIKASTLEEINLTS